jgi:YHS domain-containing protein
MLARTVVLIAAILVSPAALAQKPPVFSDRDGAIRGHDPVACFHHKRQVEGAKQFSYPWRGATWYFASADHRSKFRVPSSKSEPSIQDPLQSWLNLEP